jgi:hypothetical protein
MAILCWAAKNSLRGTAMCVIKEKKSIDLIAAFCLFVRPSPISFALLGGTGNRLKSKTTANLKEKKNLDRHGPRPITNICHLLSPPSLSLQTTFKIKLFYFILSTEHKCANCALRQSEETSDVWTTCPVRVPSI